MRLHSPLRSRLVLGGAALATFAVLPVIPSDAADCTCDTFTSAGGIGSFALLAENNGTSGHTHGVEARVLSPDGMAVHAYNDATTGWAIAVEGDTASSTGAGVYGYHGGTGAGFGTYGDTYSSTGTGVYGNHGATTGQGYGVRGVTASTSGRGVYGQATPTTGTNYGVYGSTASSSGRGVYGAATRTTGTNYGVYGTSASTAGRGVYGAATAATGTTYGVYGQATSTSGYGVYCSGNFTVTGTKASTVATPYGPTELYAVESTEVWFEDIGGGTLVNGRAHVDLDADFLDTVLIDEENPMRVFIQLEGPANAVFVAKGQDGFDVVEQGRPSSNASFTYRVLAKRAGYQDLRLRRVDVQEDEFMGGMK